MDKNYPQNIVCMTEESVETLFLLGKGDLIKGVSAYVKRPPEARKIKTISAFTHANFKKIRELSPDLILGFSDIQKDIARDLIGDGFNVFIANHRSIEGILSYILMLGSLVGEREKSIELIDRLKEIIQGAKERGRFLKRAPRVYLEEWDDPIISGIQWFSEIISICGGEDIFEDRSKGALASDRFVKWDEVAQKEPDIIFGCWCGKKVDIESFSKRDGSEKIPAIKNGHVYELEPEIFLQPGPAPILSGVDLVLDLFEKWDKAN